jgi:radical SAM superfamily enzyme YgiQ (UPF0313 family)
MREHAIPVVGSFIIGLDHDTEESLDATVEFTIRQKLFAVLFNMLVPFPETDLYRQFQLEGRLRYPRWWLDENYRYGQAVFQPKNFSVARLEEKRLEMYRQFFSAKSIISRMHDPIANLQDPWHALVYLTLNLPAYTQEFERTGKRLELNHI